MLYLKIMRVIISLFFASISLGAAPIYQFTTFGIPGSTETAALGINNPGDVVGTGQEGFQTKGFLRRPDGALEFSSISGDQGNTQLSGIDDAGQIVGFYGVRGTNMGHSFLRRVDGSMEVFEAPGDSGSTFAFGLNNRGEIAGSVDAGNGTQALGFIRHANGSSYETFSVGGSSLTSAFGINDLGQVTGNFYTEGGTASTGYIRNADGSVLTFEIPGRARGVTFPIGINNAGTVVGSFALNSGFVRNPDGSFYELNYPGAYARCYMELAGKA